RGAGHPDRHADQPAGARARHLAGDSLGRTGGVSMTSKISDELLFAYIDNELDAAARAEVEAVIAADPALAKRVDEQRALRTLLSGTFDPILSEPVPERLLAATQAPAPKARVVALAAAREQRRAREAPAGRWGDDWELRVRAQDAARAGAEGRLRMAASPIPAAVLKVVDEQISGSPLDADSERAAMQRGWRTR